MTDPDRLRCADAVEANWPELAAYIREMAGEPDPEEIHDDDDGSTD